MENIELEKGTGDSAFFNENQSRIQSLVDHYGNYPLHSLWQKTDKEFFFHDLGAVAFEKSGSNVVVAGDPLVLDEGDEQIVFDAFVKQMNNLGHSVCGYYFSEAFVDKLSGFKIHKAGVSRILNFSNYDSKGYESRDVRRALNQGRRAGLEFIEVKHKDKLLYLDELKRKERKWLRGKKGPRIGFLLSKIATDFPGAHREKWFLIKGDSGIEAFVSCLEYKENEKACVYVDHLLQFKSGHKFALDFLLAQLILKFEKEEILTMSLGFNAFQKTQPDSAVGLGLWLNQLFEPVYEARGLYMFKRKFTNLEEPRYLVMQEDVSWMKQVMAMIKVTFGPKKIKNP